MRFCVGRDCLGLLDLFLKFRNFNLNETKYS